jgi:hypothetical protein
VLPLDLAASCCDWAGAAGAAGAAGRAAGAAIPPQADNTTAIKLATMSVFGVNFLAFICVLLFGLGYGRLVCSYFTNAIRQWLDVALTGFGQRMTNG